MDSMINVYCFMSNGLVTKGPKNYFRYLLTDSRDQDWGIYATSAGYVDISPGVEYPPPGHPENYMFSWAKGRLLDEMQIHFISRGSGVFDKGLNGKGRLDLHPGSVFILFPNVWHRYAPLKHTGWFEYWIGLKGEYIERLIQQRFFTPSDPVYALSDSSSLLDFFTESILYLRSHPVGTSRSLGSLGGLILSELISEVEPTSVDSSRLRHLVREAKLMLSQHLEQDLELESLAKKLHVGYHWLRRAYKKETGQSLHQYRLQLRINRAKVLLRSTENTVEQIAFDSGFPDPYHFSQIFRKKCGRSPTEWRKQL